MEGSMSGSHSRLDSYKPWRAEPWSDRRQRQFHQEIKQRRRKLVAEARRRGVSVREILRLEVGAGEFESVNLEEDKGVSLEELLDLEAELIEELEEEERELFLLKYCEGVGQEKAYFEDLIKTESPDSLDVSAMTLGGSTATTGIDIDDSWAPFLEEDDDMNDSEVKVTSEDDEPSGDGKGSRVHATTVLCPICMKQWLYEIDGLCGCTCGFRLNSRNDGVDAEHLRKRLDALFQGHSERCQETPKCKQTTRYGNSHLVFHCDKCGTSEIVV